MAKRLIIILFFLGFTAFDSNAQDTSPYEMQRAKINALLAERSAKFGQYDHSLNERSGIFGFQTKKDIKNSNEILRQIALNDNEIFTQLKVLMDYKDLQVEQVKIAVNANAESILNYRKTIKELQDQNKKLNTSVEKSESGNGATVFLFLFIIATAILSYLLFTKSKQIKNYQNTSLKLDVMPKSDSMV